MDALTQLVALPEETRNALGLTDTPREIQQQPETWLQTVGRMQSMRSSLLNACSPFGMPPRSGRLSQVILAGAGSSDYIGRCLAGLLEKQWGCTVRAIPSTNLVTNLDTYIAPQSQCLLISFSRSGDSSEGVALIQLAHKRYAEQVRHLVVTCNAAGAMAKMPGMASVVLDDAVNDRGLAMTSSFTNMVVAGQHLAYFNQPDEYETLVRGLSSMGSNLLPRAADLAASIAKRRFSRVCFLGSDALQGVAQESALKVLELNAGRIATLAESFLGVRHGPLSFLNQETLVCAFLSGDEPRVFYELDLLEEIRKKQLAAELIIATPHSSPRIRDLTENVLDLQAPPEFPSNMRSPVDVIVGQLLALFLSIENGIRPDTPSSGAISRVVSHVNIYPAAEAWSAS